MGRCPAAQGPPGGPGWAPREERWPQADTPISAPLLDLLGFRKRDTNVRPCTRGAAKPELRPLLRASSLDSPVHPLRIPHLSPACFTVAPCLGTHPVERPGGSGRAGCPVPDDPRWGMNETRPHPRVAGATGVPVPGGQACQAHSGAWMLGRGGQGRGDGCCLLCARPFVGPRRRNQTPQFTEEAPDNKVAK